VCIESFFRTFFGGTRKEDNLFDARHFIVYTQSTKMRFIEDLCPPALLYALFLAIQLGLDAADLAWMTFTWKLVFGGATVFVLDMLCRLNLGIVSWFIMAVPFIVTALATSIAMGLQIDRMATQAVREHLSNYGV
jgi:hypothetical protein